MGKYQTAFLAPDMWGLNLSAALTGLFNRKKKSVVLERLTHFDPRIADIDILQDGVYVDLDEMLREHSEYQNELRLYTIGRPLKKGLQSFKYTCEGLNGACASDVEIRNIINL